MTITYIPDSDSPLLAIIAQEITDFIANIDDYTGVTVTATLTCTNTPIVQTYDITAVLVTTNKFYIVDVSGVKTLFISPSLFSGTTFVDGIYKFDIKFNTPSGYIQISNCSFVDVTFKCKVASLMQNIIGENATRANTEKISTVIHLLHYSLVNGSNCGCNCEDMCTVFNGLKQLLLDIDPQILNDCGC